MSKQPGGRPTKRVDKDAFLEQARRYCRGELTAKQAAAALGISRTTFFRRLDCTQLPDGLCRPRAQQLQRPEPAAQRTDLRYCQVFRCHHWSDYVCCSSCPQAVRCELLCLNDPERCRLEDLPRRGDVPRYER